MADNTYPPGSPAGYPVQRRVMISGYYGFDNLGDDLILHVLIAQLKQRHCEIVVLSNNPQETRQRFGVEAIHRTSLKEIYLAFETTHLFISGGGGLLQDSTGPMSVIYYGGLMGLAKFFGLPVCLWAQGIGPLKSWLSRQLVRQVILHVDRMTVRDQASAALLGELCDRPVEVTADPVWLLDLPKTVETDPYRQHWTVGLSLRPWPGLNNERLKHLLTILSELARIENRSLQLLLFPFQPKQDVAMFQQLIALLRDFPQITWQKVESRHVINRIGGCDAFIGMRFHSLILAILSDVKVWGLVYDPKVRQMLDALGLEGTDIQAMAGLSATQVGAFWEQYPRVDLEAIRHRAARNVAVLDLCLQQEVSPLMM
ncbi:MAG: polysaccharide pyruvyl transferase CsaB [Candidatus Melainabacteria bacterium]